MVDSDASGNERRRTEAGGGDSESLGLQVELSCRDSPGQVGYVRDLARRDRGSG